MTINFRWKRINRQTCLLKQIIIQSVTFPLMRLLCSHKYYFFIWTFCKLQEIKILLLLEIRNNHYFLLLLRDRVLKSVNAWKMCQKYLFNIHKGITFRYHLRFVFFFLQSNYLFGLKICRYMLERCYYCVTYAWVLYR